MKTRIILGAIAVMVVTTSAVFATLLFTQTFPPVTRSSPIVANCTTLSVEGPIPSLGATGVIRFDCSGSPAFTVTTGATVVPTFTIQATGYTALAVVTSTDNCDVSTPIVSGTAYFFGAGDVDYCAQVDTSTADLPTFTIDWNV